MMFRRARRCATLSLLLLSCQANAQSRFIVQPKQGIAPVSERRVAKSAAAPVVANHPVIPDGGLGQASLSDDVITQSPFGGEAIQWVKRGENSDRHTSDEPQRLTTQPQISSQQVPPQQMIEGRVAVKPGTLLEQPRIGNPNRTGYPGNNHARATVDAKVSVGKTFARTANGGRHFGAGIPTVTQGGSKTSIPNAVPVQNQLVSPQQEAGRQRLAQTVSSKIIASQPKPPSGAGQLVALNRSIGWDAIGERLRRKSDRCNNLLMRNAFFSARQEAQESVVELVRALDKVENRFHCEPALLAAQQALREAEDFASQQRTSGDKDMLRRIVDSHQTPILKQQNLANVPPLAAAEHYRLYALQSLLEAAQGHPWSSEVYYLIGRTFHAQADNRDGVPELLREKAAVYYQAATTIMPNNALASNQLGYILLQKGQPVEAKEALVASVGAGATPSSLANLAEASRRLGDSQTMQWATANLHAMQPPTQGPRIPDVIEVDNRRFAAMSPQAAGPPPIAR